ncbi:Sodium/hydrogen exchanger 9 [Liparis tanakae]|uniref:Sodium/hydrogen exchanger 9 n=1 Tax=Liparis tanakae TaxID=230148 RepID=A0A4Z2I812_9TELE|nr:Sodium/hydrogen exchanger 9 [Liparis tanakae]
MSGTATHNTETFDPEVLFNLFLPPIIVHGAHTLNQREILEVSRSAEPTCHLFVNVGILLVTQSCGAEHGIRNDSQ